MWLWLYKLWSIKMAHCLSGNNLCSNLQLLRFRVWFTKTVILNSDTLIMHQITGKMGRQWAHNIFTVGKERKSIFFLITYSFNCKCCSLIACSFNGHHANIKQCMPSNIMSPSFINRPLGGTSGYQVTERVYTAQFIWQPTSAKINIPVYEVLIATYQFCLSDGKAFKKTDAVAKSFTFMVFSASFIWNIAIQSKKNLHQGCPLRTNQYPCSIHYSHRKKAQNIGMKQILFFPKF